MPRVRCPHCDKLLSVPDKLAGKAGLCPNCKKKVDIPPLKSKPDDDDDIVDDFEEEEEDKAPARRSKRAKDDDDDSNERIVAGRGRGAARSRRDDEEDDRPSKRRRSRDDDEEDSRPRRRSRSDDDDDDEPPKRKSSSPPRRRRRKRSSSSGAGGSTMMIVGLVGGGICLLCCILGLVFPPLVIVPLALGYLLAFIGGIWFLIVAFQDDVVQGLLCWFIPFYSLFYLITHFEEEKYPFFTQMAGMILIMVAACAGGAGAGIHEANRRSHLIHQPPAPQTVLICRVDDIRDRPIPVMQPSVL